MARYEASGVPVRYRLGSDLVGACLFLSDLRKPQPALLFIHDRQGVDSQSLGVAERYAHVGYGTLAVDLFLGAVPASPTEADAMAARLEARDTEAHLWTALAWLRAHPRVRADRVGAIGLGTGGALALLLATSDAHVTAAVSCDGDAQTAASLPHRVRAPVLGLFSGEDAGPIGAVERLRSGLKRTGVPHSLRVYAGARRGFFNERSAQFDFESAEDAWSRSNKFFYRYLGEPSDT